MHAAGTYNNPWIYQTTQFFSFTTNRVSSKKLNPALELC